MMYLTRKYDFCASHRLHNPEFSEDKNLEVFRECSNTNGHGHNYELEVTVGGEVDSETGMVVDMLALDQCVQKHLLDKVDHKHMNFDVEFLAGKIPTAEVMVHAFWGELAPHIPGTAKLVRLRLLETKKNFAEYRG